MPPSSYFSCFVFIPLSQPFSATFLFSLHLYFLYSPFFCLFYAFPFPFHCSFSLSSPTHSLPSLPLPLYLSIVSFSFWLYTKHSICFISNSILSVHGLQPLNYDKKLLTVVGVALNEVMAYFIYCLYCTVVWRDLKWYSNFRTMQHDSHRGQL